MIVHILNIQISLPIITLNSSYDSKDMSPYLSKAKDHKLERSNLIQSGKNRIQYRFRKDQRIFEGC